MVWFLAVCNMNVCMWTILSVWVLVLHMGEKWVVGKEGEKVWEGVQMLLIIINLLQVLYPIVQRTVSIESFVGESDIW